jgi:hypothetical protein
MDVRKEYHMTIGSLAIATSPTVNSTAIGTAVLAKSLDAIETTGQGMIKMMEQSVTPYLGNNIDIKL